MTRAGAQSLNLQAANHVIVYDIPFAISALIQCLGRVTRMDTKHDKIYLHMIETLGTIDTYKKRLIQDHFYLIEKLFGDGDKSFIQIERLEKDALTQLKRSLLWSTSGIRKSKR